MNMKRIALATLLAFTMALISPVAGIAAAQAANGTVTSVIKTVALPAAITNSTCQILHLDLGPLSLDILGLQVNLSRVVLDITAQAGAGNLLGNLLCGVANLLNDPNGLVRLLNSILGAL